MSFFVGTLDFTCHENVAYEYIEQMSTETNIIDAGYTNHWYWSLEANNAWFMTNLLEQLAIT